MSSHVTCLHMSHVFKRLDQGHSSHRKAQWMLLYDTICYVPACTGRRSAKVPWPAARCRRCCMLRQWGNQPSSRTSEIVLRPSRATPDFTQTLVRHAGSASMWKLDICGIPVCLICSNRSKSHLFEKLVFQAADPLQVHRQRGRQVAQVCALERHLESQKLIAVVCGYGRQAAAYAMPACNSFRQAAARARHVRSPATIQHQFTSSKRHVTSAMPPPHHALHHALCAMHFAPCIMPTECAVVSCTRDIAHCQHARLEEYASIRYMQEGLVLVQLYCWPCPCKRVSEQTV